MIIELKPLSLSESEEIVENVEGKEDKKEIKVFIKRFNKTSIKDAKAIREELEKLGILKLKPENIVKIIDLMPEDESDIAKIFPESNITNEEVNKILELIKKYK